MQSLRERSPAHQVERIANELRLSHASVWQRARGECGGTLEIIIIKKAAVWLDKPSVCLVQKEPGRVVSPDVHRFPHFKSRRAAVFISTPAKSRSGWKKKHLLCVNPFSSSYTCSHACFFFFFSKGSLLQLCPTSVTTRKVEISSKFDGKRFGLELFKLDYWGFSLSAARLYGFLRGGRQIWMHVTRLIPDCFIVIHVKTCSFQFADIITLVVDLLN